MAYSTQADLVEQISEADLIDLTDDDGLENIDESIVMSAIAAADAKIDSYCARYSVPFTTVPSVIKGFSVDIAIYNLYGRRPGTLPEERKRRYEDAIGMLKDIAKGVASLGAGDPAGNPPAANSPQMATGNPARIFSRANLSGF